jgi:hypothetical protein
LVIGSFGYSADDVIYHWATPVAVSIDKLGLAQFHLKDYKIHESIEVMDRRTRYGFRNDSTASLDFRFERQTGFFLLQIYTPLTLIVFCSWVAFWLIKTEKGGEVPARTALGATSVLSVVNIGFGGKSRPQVPYATALDTFIILCFVAVFAALVEFACINFLDTYVKRRKMRIAQLKRAAEENTAKNGTENGIKIDTEGTKGPKNGTEGPLFGTEGTDGPFTGTSTGTDGPTLVMVRQMTQEELFNGIQVEVTRAEEEEEAFEDIEDEANGGEVRKTLIDHCKQIGFYCSEVLFSKFENAVEAQWGPVEEMNFYVNTTEVIWTIDACARMGFPLVFLILQCFYWTSYLYVL